MTNIEKVRGKWRNESTGLTPVEFTMQMLEEQKKEIIKKISQEIHNSIICSKCNGSGECIYCGGDGVESLYIFDALDIINNIK